MFEHIDHHEIFGSFMRYLSNNLFQPFKSSHKKKNKYQKRPKRKPENIEWKPTKVKEKQNKTTNNQWHAHSQQNSKPDHRESTRTWRIVCMKLYYQLNRRCKNLLSRMWNWLELASCLLRYQRWRANGTRWLCLWNLYLVSIL